MAMYAYVKAPVGARNSFFQNHPLVIQKTLNILPTAFILLGAALLLIVAQPIVSYKFLVFSKERKKIITPIPNVALVKGGGFINPLVLGSSTASNNVNQPKFGKNVDYHMINNWFPTAPLPHVKPSRITHYTLSIPELKIENAVVEIGGTEVKHSLIHYPGTALPGEFGNTVIFGHSVLPTFYNPKDYEAIFSLIPTLDKGDRIYVDFDGIRFVYEAEEYQEVKPEDIEVLEQRFDQQTLSLITCVPPGTYWKRGIVMARLVRT